MANVALANNSPDTTTTPRLTDQVRRDRSFLSALVLAGPTHARVCSRSLEVDTGPSATVEGVLRVPIDGCHHEQIPRAGPATRDPIDCRVHREFSHRDMQKPGGNQSSKVCVSAQTLRNNNDKLLAGMSTTLSRTNPASDANATTSSKFRIPWEGSFARSAASKRLHRQK